MCSKGLPGVAFEDAAKRVCKVASQGHEVPIIGREDLIAHKEAVGRDQDLVDVKALRAAR
jgi:hypothetical protein